MNVLNENQGFRNGRPWLVCVYTATHAHTQGKGTQWAPTSPEATVTFRPPGQWQGMSDTQACDQVVSFVLARINAAGSLLSR